MMEFVKSSLLPFFRVLPAHGMAMPLSASWYFSMETASCTYLEFYPFHLPGDFKSSHTDNQNPQSLCPFDLVDVLLCVLRRGMLCCVWWSAHVSDL